MIRIPDRIAAEMKRRKCVPYDEMVELIRPSGPCASPELKARRRAAVVKGVGRARVMLAASGWRLACIPLGQRGCYALQLVRFPDHPVDDQTMAELTMGRHA